MHWYLIFVLSKVISLYRNVALCNKNMRKLTLVCAVHRASSPVRSLRSWRSSDPIGTCYLASNLDERPSENGYTRRRWPFVSCNTVLPAPWLCLDISARASNSVQHKRHITLCIGVRWPHRKLRHIASRDRRSQDIIPILPGKLFTAIGSQIQLMFI